MKKRFYKGYRSSYGTNKPFKKVYTVNDNKSGNSIEIAECKIEDDAEFIVNLLNKKESPNE